MEAIRKGEVDIFICAETWYMHYAEYVTHPYVVYYTPHSEVQRKNHHPGGLAIFVSPTIRNYLSLITITPYFIYFSLFGINILSVYLPPSLSITSLSSLLTPIAPPHLFFGDINVRYGRMMGDTASTAPKRRELLEGLAGKWGLHLTPPIEGVGRTDHVFANHTINLSWIYDSSIRERFAIDHGLMKINLSTSYLPPPCSSPASDPTNLASKPSSRFNIRYLACEQTRNLLASCFESLALHLTPAVEYLTSLRPYLRSQAQEIVDIIEALVTEAISTAAEEILGLYNPVTIRQTPLVLPHDSLTPSQQAAINLVRRLQRSSRTNPHLESRDPNRSAMEDAMSYFTDIFVDPSSPPLQPPPLPYGTSFFSRFISPKTITKVIRAYPGNKAPGWDALQGRIFKSLLLSPSFLSIITMVFRYYACVGVTPSGWNLVNIHLIPKVDLARTVNDRRPISLTSMNRRFFETLLLHFWNGKGELVNGGFDENEDWEKLEDLLDLDDLGDGDIWSFLNTEEFPNFHKSQAGFRKGFSTASHILLSNHMSLHGYSISVFLDLKQAYDRPPHHLLSSMIDSKFSSPHTRSLLYNLNLSNIRSRLLINGSLSPPFVRNRGLVQGGIHSPSLWNHFIDPLLVFMEQTSSDILPPSLAFADDLNNKARSHYQAQLQMDIVSDWASTNGAELNVRKCGVVGLPVDDPDLVYNGETIPRVEFYKYLGAPHGSRGILWAKFIRENVEKATRTLGFYAIRGRLWAEITKISVYKIFIRPTFEYLAPLVHTWLESHPEKDGYWKVMDSFHLSALEWIYGFKGSRTVLEMMADLPPPILRFEELRCSFRNHLSNLHPDNPVLVAKNSSFPIADQSDILPRIFLHTQLAKNFDDREEPDKYEWKYWRYNNRKAFWEQQPGILHKYFEVRRDIRFPRTEVDHILLYPDRKVRRSAIKWRSNRLFPFSPCPSCQQTFRRTHIHRCHLLDLTILDDTFTWGGLDAERKRQSLERYGDHGDFPKGYTILDGLLDACLVKEFGILIEKLFTLMPTLEDNPGAGAMEPEMENDGDQALE